MLLEIDVKIAVEKAMLNPENRLPNGDINWNFVDADAFADCCGTDYDLSDRFYDMFDGVCDQLVEKLNIS